MVYKLISANESQVGKYIDVNGDGIPEGIIFIDLIADKEKQIKYDNKVYKIPAMKKDDVKEYVAGGKYNHKLNGEQEIIIPISNGKARFYIMALKDISEHWCHWYANVSDMKDYATTTAIDFGQGQNNTISMIVKWNNKDYGSQDSFDVWNITKQQVEDGWFVPSTIEWKFFRKQLNINRTNYEEKALKVRYWTSSQIDCNGVYIEDMNRDFRKESVGFARGISFARLARKF